MKKCFKSRTMLTIAIGSIYYENLPKISRKQCDKISKLQITLFFQNNIYCHKAQFSRRNRIMPYDFPAFSGSPQSVLFSKFLGKFFLSKWSAKSPRRNLSNLSTKWSDRSINHCKKTPKRWNENDEISMKRSRVCNEMLVFCKHRNFLLFHWI